MLKVQVLLFLSCNNLIIKLLDILNKNFQKFLKKMLCVMKNAVSLHRQNK